MADGVDFSSAIRAIKSASKKIKLTPELEESIEQLNSITKLINIDTPSPAVLQRLSSLLRQNLLPLYNTFLILGIRYAVAVLGKIFNTKVLPAVKKLSTNSVSAWEAVQASLLSGVLDFLEKNASNETRDVVANSLYPTLRDVFFHHANTTFRPGPDLMCILCQVLSETITSHPDNQAQLRNKDILGGADIGTILSQSKDILVIEALLELIVKLLPSKRTSATARIEFVQEVFNAAKFACGDVILKILETTPSTANWDIVFIKIIDLLGNTDSSFPQPFKISNFHVQHSRKTYNVERLYVDHLAFVANIDEDDQIETLHALYVSVQNLKVAAPQNGKAAVNILFSPPPSVGQVALVTPLDRGATVTFDIEAEDVARFLSSLKLRNVKSIDFHGKKVSKPEKFLDLNFKPKNKNTVSTQDKGRDLARLWDISNSQSQAGQVLPTSPLMPRVVSEIQDASTSTAPIKPSNAGSAAKSSSPYYDSIFGTTDEELTDPSDTELNPTPRRSTRLSRGKQLRSVVKPRPAVVESDSESQIIQKVRSKRKTIVLSDIEAEQIKSQNVPETTKPNLSTSLDLNSRPLSEPKLAEGNPSDVEAANGVKGEVAPKRDSAGDTIHQPDPSSFRPNERPKLKRKRKSPGDHVPETDNMENDDPPVKRLRTRPEPAKNIIESKPPPKLAPVKRYGRKGRTSSPPLSSGPELDFDGLPVTSSPSLSRLEEKPRTVSTMKDKGGKTATAKVTTDTKRLKTTKEKATKEEATKEKATKEKATKEKATKESTAVSSKDARARKGKTLFNNTKGPLLDKMMAEDKENHSTESVPQRRSARVARPDIADESTKMDQRQTARSTVKRDENIQDEDASELQRVRPQKKSQRVPWEKLDVENPASPFDITETIVTNTVESLAAPTIVQDAIARETHVTTETSTSLTILQETVAQENRDTHMLNADYVEPVSSKKSTDDIFKPSKSEMETQKVLIDLTKDSPPQGKPPTKSIVRKNSKPRMKSPTPSSPSENISDDQSITLPPSPESRPFLSKPDRPRVSFAIQPTFDLAPGFEIQTSKSSYHPRKNENISLGNHYRRSQSYAQKFLDNEHTEQTTKKHDMDPMPKILGILDEINKAIKHKSSYRFSKFRKDFRAGERAILSETAQHLEDTYIESVRHHNNFVNLEMDYASHHRKIIDGLKDAIENDQKTATFLASTIQEHSLNSLSRKFPNNFFDSPLPPILLNPQLKF